MPLEDLWTKLQEPDFRCVDCRVVESQDDFVTAVQFLGKDDKIYSTESSYNNMQKRLELFRLNWNNNPRNNPALYGLLDEKVTDNGK